MNPIILAFAAATTAFDLPPGLLSAVCYVESSHRSHVVHVHDGGASSIGLCQVKLATAKLLGFKGTEEQLKLPSTNAHYAAAYLRRQLNRYDGSFVKAVAAYNSGTFRAAKDGSPLNQSYVRKVFNAWILAK